VYGTSEEGVRRQALHAWRVAFPHPVTRTAIELESPPPLDLQQFLRRQNLTL
jgi:23S rRNA-/tRNA-specific pseudouridylate synthase